MGISAGVEVTGLILWDIDLWRAMGRRPEDMAVASGATWQSGHGPKCSR